MANAVLFHEPGGESAVALEATLLLPCVTRALQSDVRVAVQREELKRLCHSDAHATASLCCALVLSAWFGTTGGCTIRPGPKDDAIWRAKLRLLQQR